MDEPVEPTTVRRAAVRVALADTTEFQIALPEETRVVQPEVAHPGAALGVALEALEEAGENLQAPEVTEADLARLYEEPLETAAEPQSTPVATPVATPAPVPAPVPQRPERRHSVIGPDLHIVGTISSAGSVRIEGRLDGDLACRALAVGQTGTLVGNVTALIAEIAGTLQGNVTADTVVLAKTARLAGEITQRNLTIESGAQFEGTVRRRDAKEAPTARRDPAKPGAKAAAV